MPADHTSAANLIDHLAASPAAPDRDRAARNPDMPRRFSKRSARRQQQPIIDDPDFKGRAPTAAAAAAACRFFKAIARFHASGRLARQRRRSAESDDPSPFLSLGISLSRVQDGERIELEHA